MPASLASDPRFSGVPADRWDRAARMVERGWLRDARVVGTVASGTCVGLVGVRMRVDLATLASVCECGASQPCEHALALLLKVLPSPPAASARGPVLDAETPKDGEEAAPPISAPPRPDPPAPATTPARMPAPATALRLRGDANDPGRVVLDAGPDLVPDAAAERLRWVWWRREGASALSGETRTLAQACQLLVELQLPVAAVPEDASLAGACALFRQRALGEPVHVRVLDPAGDASLGLAHLLADRGARPHAGKLPAEHWTLDDPTAFAGFFLEASRRGAEVRADLTLNPKPLEGVEAQLDAGCLPARLAGELEKLGPHVKTLVGGEPVVDTKTGHVLVPAARVVDVEEGLRALGADIHYRRLAPAGERYLEWPAELPEDLHGARPRLREPFTGPGIPSAAIPNLREGVALAPYQETAVAFLAHHRHTCLLADDMGLGKTLESIAAAQLVEGKVLVVCPASARAVWEGEVRKFTTESSLVLGPGDHLARIPRSGAPSQPSEPSRKDSVDTAHSELSSERPQPTTENAKYTITGYSNLEAIADELDVASYQLVILDESHYVKNAGTGRAKLVREKLSAIPRRLVISGTPVMNTPEEVRAQLAFLHPEEWSDVGWFRKRFVEPFDGGTPEVRSQILARLRQFLEGVMLRREKREALPDLPPKRIEWHRVKLRDEARRAYVALEDEYDAVARSDGVGSAKAGGKLERLKQAALAGKLPEALAFVRARVAEGAKVVVFSRYRDALRSVETELADLGVVTLTGDSSAEERAESARRFQEDPACRVFAGQLVAAGTALTLIAGTHAVFLDLSWNPADHRQAMDRIHRRGQTRPVTAHFFLAEETVDEDIATTLDEKGEMMDALLGTTAQAGGAPKGVRSAVGQRVLARRAAPVSA